MAKSDLKQQAADKVAAAKNQVAKWKRKQKTLVNMPELTGNPETDSKNDLDAVMAMKAGQFDYSVTA